MSTSANPITATEGQKVEQFLRQKFNTPLLVKLRQRPDQCAELYLGAECLGVIEKVVDEGETSYAVEISIIQEDLEEVA